MPYPPPSSVPLSVALLNVQSNKFPIIPTAEFLSMWNWDVENFSSPGAHPVKRLLHGHIHWLGVETMHFGSSCHWRFIQPKPRMPPSPTSDYPCPPSLPSVDTCSVWHLDWLPHCQWSRGPWLMCSMHRLACSLWNRDDMLDTLQI